MNVDVAAKCISVLRLASTQPENSRHDRIATRRIWCHNFTCADSVFEHGARRCVIANLLCYFQLTQRRAAASQGIPQPEFRSRDGIGGQQRTVIEDGELLIASANDDVMLRVGRCARPEK